MEMPKRERLQEFFRRLKGVPEASTFDEAFMQIANILTAVEDELTDIPCNPERWRSDGRLYPPQRDSVRAVESSVRVKRLRSLSHNTFIGDNGSIEIAAIDGTVLFRKPGVDGDGVWDLG